MMSSPNTAPIAIDRLVGVLGEDALFVLATGVRDPKDALEALVARRGPAYTAAVQGLAHSRMTSQLPAWTIEMARALAPISPPTAMPMMDVVREKVTLEIGARGLRSLFSSKPSEKDVARVKRYGSLAVRVLRAVLAADGMLDEEERTTIAALVASLGLPEADASPLYGEPPVAPATLDVYGEIDHAVARAILRGAWLAAAQDSIDPREEGAIRVVAKKLSIADDETESMRRDAVQRVETRRAVGFAAVDGVRYVLRDRCPGIGVQIAAHTARLMVPRRWRDEALAPVGQGTEVALAKRHAGLEAEERQGVLGVAWAAAMVDDPTEGRRALLRARWERFASDLGEDDPTARELVERWIGEALVGVARTLP
jgi:tellurite resistance protein